MLIKTNNLDKSIESNDVLLGAAAVQNYINAELSATPLTRGQIYHWIEAGYLPAGRVGGKIVGSKRVIKEHFERLAGGNG
jgi:hypothetical protein